MTFSKRLQRCKENWPHLVIQPFLPSSTNLLSLNWNWKLEWWTTACNYSVMLEKKLTESQKLWGADCKNFYNFVAAQSFTLFGHFDFQDSWSHLDQLFNLEWAVPHGERGPTRTEWPPFETFRARSRLNFWPRHHACSVDCSGALHHTWPELAAPSLCLHLLRPFGLLPKISGASPSCKLDTVAHQPADQTNQNHSSPVRKSFVSISSFLKFS